MNSIATALQCITPLVLRLWVWPRILRLLCLWLLFHTLAQRNALILRAPQHLHCFGLLLRALPRGFDWQPPWQEAEGDKYSAREKERTE